MAAEKKTPSKGGKPALKKAAKPQAPKSEEPALVAPDEVEEEEQAREPQGEEAGKPAAKTAVRPVRRAAKTAPADEEPKETDEEPAQEPKAKPAKKHAARPSAKLSPELKKALAQRADKDAHRPEFHRQEWFRYQRLGTKWRAPGGIQSKMRRHWGTHADVVSIGYRGPKAARGLHPSGFREVMVHSEESLGAVDPKTEAVRISSSVGRRKREIIQKAAAKRGIRVLNWRQL
jgi:large subunit ribosomal protein L32e